MLRIGVLSFQGDVSEHMDLVRLAGAEPVAVKNGTALASVSGLVLPGGESTCQGKLLNRCGMDRLIIDRITSGMPVFGTCTGAILLAREIEGSSQHRLGTMGIRIARNIFGSQIDSFETGLEIKGITDSDRYGKGEFRALFIRGPLITGTDPGVEVMAVYDGKIAMARQDNMLACSFHPEMGQDPRVHRYFADMAEEYERGK